MTLPLVVYGVPLSPPFRSVVWALLQKQQPFKIQLTIPGATTKIGSRNESFLSKTRGRTAIVPVLEEDSTFALSESPAILAYLCESRAKFADLYGLPGTREKAYIDEYLHWHHGNTKKISLLTIPFIRPDLVAGSTVDTEKAEQALHSLDQAWLRDDSYIASTEQHSIADLLAYEEVAQASMTGAMDLAAYPNLLAWVERMERIPFHSEVHAALKTLGSLTDPSSPDAGTPMAKRLGAATKDGLQAIQAAQDGFGA